MNEGYVYIISTFGVSKNSYNFRATQHEFRLIFQGTTRVAKVGDDLAICRYGLDIASFAYINDRQTNLNYLIGNSHSFIIYELILPIILDFLLFLY